MPEQSSEDQYGWLYGNKKESRVAPRAADDLPPPQLPPPGRNKGSSRPPKGPKKRKPIRKVIGIVVVLWIIFLIAVPVWAWGRIAQVDAEPTAARPGNQLGTNYLLVGSDSRRGLTKQQQKDLSTGGDSGGPGRTDTIMIMHVGKGPTLLMSIPRDSLVPIKGYGITKINAAYAYGGPKLLVSTLEQTTGLRIDNYVEVGFGGLVNVVDSVGGVEICPTTNIKDKDSGLDVKKGCQQANGKTALAFSRSRHSYATQDIQRVQSQRQVLGSIANKVKSPSTVLNPFRYQATAAGASGSLQIGKNVSPIDLGRFALNLSSAMSGKGLSCTIPLRDFAVRWDSVRALKMLDFIKNDETGQIGSLCTKDGLPKK
ncbi:MAG: LCP family protein [Kineosporiaceae bacterium]|nr:LCP family protein [Aeromicrobium sp.]